MNTATPLFIFDLYLNIYIFLQHWHCKLLNQGPETIPRIRTEGMKVDWRIPTTNTLLLTQATLLYGTLSLQYIQLSRYPDESLLLTSMYWCSQRRTRMQPSGQSPRSDSMDI